MADRIDPRTGELVTTNYGWTKPTVGASIDAWGDMLNADLDGIDSVIHGIDTRPGGGAVPSATPPANPTPGMLWFDSVGGQTYVWYNDGNSSQWVPTTNQMGGGYATTAYVDAARLGDNRIINGDMRIDQRGVASSGGGSANGYTVDRWTFAAISNKGWFQRFSGGPSGFPYSLQFTSTSAYASLAGDYFYFNQPIEADLVSDFAWGTLSAQPVTLSFWVFCSLTGTFSGRVGNGDATRSYPFTYSIPTANTWTKIAITIPGDTGGAWVMSGNGQGVGLMFDLGSGATFRASANVWASGNYVGATGAVSVVATNGATFYVTGVKLEIGSVATPYNRQSLAKSLADCQRYYQKLGGVAFGDLTSELYTGAAGSTISSMIGIPTMRAAPTATLVGSPSLTNVSTVAFISAPQTLSIRLTAPAIGVAAFYTTTSSYVTVSAEL